MLKKIIWIILFIMAILISNFLHELSHKWDYREIAHNDTLVIFNTNFTNDGKIAYYQFDYSNKDLEKYNEITEYTEIKAKSIDILFILLIMIIYFYCPSLTISK